MECLSLITRGKKIILTLRQCQESSLQNSVFPQKVIPTEGCTAGPKNFESLLLNLDGKMSDVQRIKSVMQ